MTDFSDPARSNRRLSLDSPTNRNTQSPPASRPESMPAHMHSRTHAPHGHSYGQPPAELIAHLVIALSRYLRQLRVEGGRVPTQLEDLVSFLTDYGRALSDVPMLRPWPAVPTSSAAPRRLLVTKSEAAERLGVSLRTIERLISAGRLPLVHVEGAARVRVTDLWTYVQSLEGDGRPNPSPADEP
jgi:excisionase family DNA binding protein